jgi:hypothetical protein
VSAAFRHEDNDEDDLFGDDVDLSRVKKRKQVVDWLVLDPDQRKRHRKERPCVVPTLWKVSLEGRLVICLIRKSPPPDGPLSAPQRERRLTVGGLLLSPK